MCIRIKNATFHLLDGGVHNLNTRALDFGFKFEPIFHDRIEFQICLYKRWCFYFVLLFPRCVSFDGGAL